MRTVTLTLGEFALEGLAAEGESDDSDRIPARAVRALRYYLSDSESGRPDWPYPTFLRSNGSGGGTALEVSIDDVVWRSLEREADRQGVSVQQLAEHAALYFAADLDAGRITQRILDNLEDES
jgi:hypothetical protein